MLFRSLKPLHPCYHLYCLSFGSYRGVVLVLVVLVMTRLSSSKTLFICVFYYAFGIGVFVGSSSWKVSLFQLFTKSPIIVLNISKGSICCPLSDKIVFTSLGFHLQKIWCFRFARERYILPPFGFIIYYWTMMFLCIIL